MTEQKNLQSAADLSAEALQERMNAIFDNLPPAQQKAVIYIRKKWEQICLMTAKEVGRKADVSEATIQRISICLGFKSFRDMKMQIKSSMLKNRAVANFSLKAESFPEQTGWLEAHVNTEMNNLVQTMRLNPVGTIENTAKLLNGAQRIWVMGDKMGAGVSEYLCFTLNYLIGKTTRINLANCHEHLSGMSETDTVVVIGFQRYCKKTLKIAKMAQRYGAKLLAFTDCSLSPFAKAADISLFAQTESVVFLDSYSAVLSLVQAVITQIIRLEPQIVKRHIARNEEAYKAY